MKIINISYAIFFLTLLNFSYACSEQNDWYTIFDGSSHKNIIDQEPSSCGDDCFDIPEWYEKYYVNSGFVYIVDPSTAQLNIYRNNNLYKMIQLGTNANGVIDIFVKGDDLFYLSRDGFVFRFNFMDKKYKAKSKRIKENDYSYLTEGGYNMSMYGDILIIRNIIKNKYYCYQSTLLENVKCDNFYVNLENSARIIENGNHVVKSEDTYVLYDDKQVIGTIKLDISKLEQLEENTYSKNGIYFLKRNTSEKATIYFYPWQIVN